MAEAERLERSQPFGLAALAEPCCTIEPRFQFGADDRPRTGKQFGLSKLGMPIPFTSAKLLQQTDYRPYDPVLSCSACSRRHERPVLLSASRLALTARQYG